jgi:hypothetical protein
MLKAFDPDLLINYSSDPLPSELKVWEHRTFPADRLDWRPTNGDVRSYFVPSSPIFGIRNSRWRQARESS